MTDQPSDKSKFHNALYEGSNREHVGRRLDLVGATTAFQADDEGSIPFTRSNVFNGLAAVRRVRRAKLVCPNTVSVDRSIVRRASA